MGMKKNLPSEPWLKNNTRLKAGTNCETKIKPKLNPE
jgi:hypothetical protein